MLLASTLLGEAVEETPTMPSRPLLIAFAAVALPLFGCASNARDAVPAGAHVEALQTGSLTLRGTQDSTPQQGCSPVTATSAKHLLELSTETTGSIELRVADAHGAATLHVTHLDDGKTWCVTTKDDGSASIPGTFASGVYAITVSGYRADPYEVVVEQM
jgi:hypothetical protein